MQSVPITTRVVSSNPIHGEVHSIHHYVIKFVGDVLKGDGFLRVSTTNETDRRDLTELLLKVALNTITIYSMYFPSYQCTQKILWLYFAGKRSKLYPIETVMLEKQQNSKQTREENIQERKMSQKRCMPLFCPFVRCPVGQHFEKGYDGCRTCRCVEVQNTGEFNKPCNNN